MFLQIYATKHSKYLANELNHFWKAMSGSTVKT
jgi:hypothetical protein